MHPRIRRLLEHWAGEGASRRPFWCQREAVETLVWLFDAGASQAPEAHAAVRRTLDEANRDWNESIPRAALKMATGTGKTQLMAMIALWWTVRQPGKAVDFLALTPGLTIREHLAEDLAKKDSETWRSVAPPGFESDLGRMRWTALNFQSFQRQSRLAVGGKKATRKEKEFLIGQGATEPESWRESEAEMLDRLLREHRGGGPITVINDEAHHCYTYKGVKVQKRREESEEREDRKRAELWFGALRALRDTGRLGPVFDLSATPMWLRLPARLEAETFPWTVSDFPLLDAIESGLVKVPRVPVSDHLIENGQPMHLQPRYRNIYLHNEKRDIGETLTPEVREPLHQLYGHYCETADVYAAKGLVPVMIVVANSIDNATMLCRYIAGHRTGEKWIRGHLELFSNSDYGTGEPASHPPTVLVHSQLDDPGAGKDGRIGKAIAAQAALFAPDATSAKDRRKAIREVFMTVGKKGEPGERIRCVISVGMLTEGWDARTVTHVFGYRAFGSQLLCEQVAGRALRKTKFSAQDEKQRIEYANLFGVPFAFLGGEEMNGPPPTPEEELVCTLPDRREFRIRFPHIVGYATSRGVPRWEVDLSKLRGHTVAHGPSTLPWDTDVGGPVGRYLELPAKARTPTRTLWHAAALLVPKLNGGPVHRRCAFACSLEIMRKCLGVMQCTDWADVLYDRDTLDRIAAQSYRIDGTPQVAPIFADHSDPGAPRTTDTSSVEFWTTLRHWYPNRRTDVPRKSELNAAACHSATEAQLAEVLDSHSDVQAWVRNFRLGWYVPWFDPERGGTAWTEPDFLARSKLRTASGRERHLIIEFKGMKAGQPSEIAKRKYLEDYWAPAASRKLNVGGEDLGDWRSVWIEDVSHASHLIAKACRMEEAR